MLRNIFKRSKRRKGATIITMIGVAGAICMFGLIFLELQTMYDYQYAIEVRAQRALNSCVEFSMDDQWRADGYNYMDTNKARLTLMDFLQEDLNVDAVGRCYSNNGKLLYDLTFGTPQYHSGNPNEHCYYCRSGCRKGAGIIIDITVTMHAGMAQYYNISSMQNGYTWTQTFSSTNFRTDNNERAGI